MLRTALCLAALLPACTAPTPEAAGVTGPADPPRSAEQALPGRIIFLAEDPEAEAVGALISMNPAGGGRIELLRGTGLYPAAVAPNGNALAVIAVEEQQGGHTERLQVHPLLADGLGPPSWRSPPASHVRNPSWGPDGRFIVYESALESFRDIYRAELPNGPLLRLTNNEEGNFEPSVAPDGSAIAFVSSRDGNAEVYRMTADGGAQTRLTSFHLDDWGPMWSPDGQTIAFLSNREQIDRIFLMRPDGGDQRRLTADQTPPPGPDAPLGSEPHETDPAFAPDGSALAFAVRSGSQGAALRVAPLPGGPVAALSDGQTSDRNPAWSPDSNHLVFVSNQDGGDLELHRITRAGSDRTRLTDRPGPDWLPRWSPR